MFALHQDLTDETYRHGNYSSFYVTDPKLRLIHKAPVRDRVLHHAIYRILYSIFDKSFIHDSYSCRLKKGTHKAVDRLEYFTRKVSKNYTGRCFVLKCDVKKFFASVDQNILLNLISGKITCTKTNRLIAEIISSFPAGLPIGNLTSQLFANIYLNEFDQYIKHNLYCRSHFSVLGNKLKLGLHYIRYTDDFVIAGNDQTELYKLISEIDYFLQNKLKLGLHPDKVNIRKLSRGVDFLGYVVLPHYRILRTKTKNRMLKRINQKNLASYLGLLRHCKSGKVISQISNCMD